MLRSFIIGLLCAAGLTSEPSRGPQLHAPWVSCFSENGQQFEGPRAVRTPLVTSADGSLKAYAEIEANEVPRQSCENTVRLFVSFPGVEGFRQVFLQKPSVVDGTANSLGPIGWSPNGRWLLVEYGNWWYDSDAGARTVLLYDRQKDRASIPDLRRLIRRSLKRECSITVSDVVGFDASSHVLLRLADRSEEGDDQPQSRCFRKVEQWSIDPERGTIKRVSGHV